MLAFRYVAEFRSVGKTVDVERVGWEGGGEDCVPTSRGCTIDPPRTHVRGGGGDGYVSSSDSLGNFS
jgi:hypothetical protein